MKIEIRGEGSQPVIMLLHPSVADSRCFEPLFPYLTDFCLILPTFGGHDVSDDSLYKGAEAEAAELLKELKSRGISDIHTMCGESLGCRIGWEILLSRKLSIRKTVFDGAPFSRFNAATRRLNYWMTMLLVRRCRKNPEKMKAIDEAYPQVASSMKQVLAHYTGKTVKNIVRDAMAGVEAPPGAIVPQDRLTVVYGSEDPYIRGMEFFENAGYPVKSVIKDGYGHCTYPLAAPEDFCRILVE